MSSDLQRLADSLGRRLGRSVAIDDTRMRLLAYTANTREVDDARRDTILNRGVTNEFLTYLNAQGASTATDIFEVAANHAIGMAIARIGVPIRHGDSRLGFLWLMGSEGALSDVQADALREAASQASLILQRTFLTDEVLRGRERELARDLFAPDAALRLEAADALIEEDLIVAGPATALVATLPHESGEPLDESARLVLQAAVDHARRRLPAKRALMLSRPDHVVLLVVWPGNRQHAAERATEELARSIRSHVVASGDVAPARGEQCWVGISETAPRLVDAHRIYGEARQAADVARVTGAVGPVVSYARLGVYALLAKLSPHDLAEAVHPGLRSLLVPGSPHVDLVRTLEAFLENAGDVQKTSSQLHIHRATLYHRIRRIEELTSLVLSQGDDRLAAHLSLKVSRFMTAE